MQVCVLLGIRHQNIYLDIETNTKLKHMQIKTSISSGEYFGDSSINVFLLMGVACVLEGGGGVGVKIPISK